VIYQPTDRRIDRLIHVLVEHATVFVPGPKIAAEIGVSDTTVWDWIEKLREMGVEIQGRARSGYRLRRLPDLLAPSLIRAELGDCEIGKKILHYFLVDSTNTVAMKLAARDVPHGTVVAAEEQTSGRGRLGRSWYSERSSGIYISVLLRPALPPSAAPILTLMAGLAAHRAVVTTTRLTPDIRWPNDLLLNGRKLGGILTEMNAEMDRVHAVILGIGINVNHTGMPPELRPVATSLRMEGGKVYSRVRLAASLLKQVELFYHMLLRDGSAAIVEQWAAASSFASGRRVRVSSKNEDRFGKTIALEANGALRVRFDDGAEESLVSGEVIEIKSETRNQKSEARN
jgi:BirA family transcriptional regulator, biotin operon repressor / biotin---[acetyl-CoA-carboxylase] ligase